MTRYGSRCRYDPRRLMSELPAGVTRSAAFAGAAAADRSAGASWARELAVALLAEVAFARAGLDISTELAELAEVVAASYGTIWSL